jgi:hypothetical protein
MARVYLSSSYQDLEEHRRVVHDVLRRLSHDVVAMEYYNAEPERPIQRCLEDVTTCDVFVGLYAWRYGTNPPGFRQSYIHLEYGAAAEHEIPRLVFLLHEDTPWPPKQVDKDQASIRSLRKTVAEEQMVSSFSSPEELGMLVATAMSAWTERRHAQDLPLGEPERKRYYERLEQHYGGCYLDLLQPPPRSEKLTMELRSVFVEQSVRPELPPTRLPHELVERLWEEGELGDDRPLPDFSLDELRERREAYYGKPTRSVLGMLTEEDGRRVVVLGDLGAGKSALARYLALRLVAASPDDPPADALADCLPLLVELGTYAARRADGRCQTFLEFLDHLAETDGLGLRKPVLEAYLGAGRPALVLFDGLDEVHPPLREEVTRGIAWFAALYPKVRIVVTSRVIGYRHHTLERAKFALYTMQDLDDDQIATFLKRWYKLAFPDRPGDGETRRERVLRAIRDWPALRELAGNPMLLTILAIIGKHRELPRDRWRVYDRAATVLLHHWDVDKYLRAVEIPVSVGERDKRELLHRVVDHMRDSKGGLAGNYIYEHELEGIFIEYFRELTPKVGVPFDVRQAAQAMIGQLEERNFILCHYGAGLYGFVHRGFLEFFCAEALFKRFKGGRSRDALVREVFGAHRTDAAWEEALLLFLWRSPDVAEEAVSYLMGLDGGDRLPRNLAFALRAVAWQRTSVRFTRLDDLLDAVGDLPERTVGGDDAEFESFVRLEVLPALTEVLVRWPEDARFLEARLEGWLAGDKDERLARGLLVSENRIVISLARVVAEALPTSQVAQELLRRMSTEVVSVDIRAEGVLALLQGWNDDPEVLRFVQDCARRDRHAEVRGVALEALAASSSGNPEVLRLVLDRAVNDTEPWVRGVALQALAKGWPADTKVLWLLRDRARRDGDQGVRRLARGLIAKLDRKVTPP